jgi:hypothetical protein
MAEVINAASIPLCITTLSAMNLLRTHERKVHLLFVKSRRLVAQTLLQHKGASGKVWRETLLDDAQMGYSVRLGSNSKRES